MSYTILTVANGVLTEEAGVSKQEIISRARKSAVGDALPLLIKSYVDGQDIENPNLLDDAISILSCGKNTAIFNEQSQGDILALAISKSVWSGFVKANIYVD